MKNLAIVFLVLCAACLAPTPSIAQDGTWLVSGMNSSNGFKTKGKALSFGTFEVSRAKYKASSTRSYSWASFQGSKVKVAYAFSVKDSSQEVKVHVSETRKMEEFSLLSKWKELAIPLESVVVQVGEIKGENFNWEYCIRDEDWFKTKQESDAGFLANENKVISITLARRVMFFYQNEVKVGELRLPFDRKFSVWLKEDLDENAKLAVSAVCGAVLLKIKDNR